MVAIEEDFLNELIDEIVALRIDKYPKGTCLPRIYEDYYKCSSDCDLCKERWREQYIRKLRNEIYAKTIKVRVIK